MHRVGNIPSHLSGKAYQEEDRGITSSASQLGGSLCPAPLTPGSVNLSPLEQTALPAGEGEKLAQTSPGSCCEEPSLAEPREETGKAGCLQQVPSEPPAPVEGVGMEALASGHLWQGLPGQFSMVPQHLYMHSP